MKKGKKNKTITELTFNFQKDNARYLTVCTTYLSKSWNKVLKKLAKLPGIKGSGYCFELDTIITKEGFRRKLKELYPSNFKIAHFERRKAIYTNNPEPYVLRFEE